MKKTTLILCILLVAIAPRLVGQNAPIATAGNVITTGSTVILPITVTSFTNIGSCDMKLFFDPAIATVTSVTATPGISGENTGFSYNITVPGAVNFGWFATPGRSIPDNSVVFSIHFTKIANGFSPVTWSTVDYECDYFGVSNTLNDSPFSTYYIPGSITFQGSAPITTILPVTACVGTDISIPVKVSNFNAIGAVSLTINYDADVLDFLPGVNTSGYPGLSVNNPSAGQIIIGGFSSSNVGETYPNNSTLCTLNFHYKGGSTALGFYDDDLESCEYSGPLGEPTLTDTPQTTYYIDGQVSGYPTPTLVSVTATDALCHGGNGTINIEYTGGTGTLNYTIGSEINTTGTFTRPANTYTYSVTDASGCPPVTGTVTVGEPTDLTATKVEGTILCNGGSTTVTITANGGTAPYTGDGIHTVSAGAYSFTVTDANGCAVVVSGTISEPTLLTATKVEGSILCNGGSTTVTITANGGTAPYAGDGIHTVSAGPYSFTVTDANGCTVVVSGTISEPALLTA
ncbi:MAG: hypothetical protein JNL22_10085, partial [Bacteroidales bacterium]|nr:hypothetical protein [Bacteroidales bacterium]